MEFTFQEYKMILDALKFQGYVFCGYNNWMDNEKSVILRHDVDISLKKAVEMAELEHSYGVSSTYFVLITADFYNAFNKRNRELIRELKTLGMEIGLHFDETIYLKDTDIVAAIKNEIQVMEQMLEIKIKSVSMHTPSKKTLEANYVIEYQGGGIVNSYSDIFFKEFKYVSDSKRNWRENVYSIIESGCYPRLHLLTHPIWYNREEISMWDTVSRVMSAQVEETYNNFEIHTLGVQGRKTVAECLRDIDGWHR